MTRSLILTLRSMAAFILLGVFASSAAAQSVAISPAEDLSDYRQIGVRVDVTGLANDQILEFVIDDQTPHTQILVTNVEGIERPPPGAALFKCMSDGLPMHQSETFTPLISASTEDVQCALSGFKTGQAYEVRAILRSSDGRVLSRTEPLKLITNVSDVRLLPPNTRPILYVLGSIFLSIITLLLGLRWWEAKSGRSQARNAYFYIGPAILALGLLTFYPIIYGIWLAFTDANQTHLGRSEFIGVQNFFEVFASSGLVQVSLFTLTWTVVNVVFHVVLGLGIALILNRQKLIGRGVYRTILLLPWAVPAYISVLAWQGLLQPEGLVNLFLGANANFLGEANSARISVTLVNIWLGVPFMMMSLAGAMKAIPTDMYEAADLDGVSRYDQFRHITFPNLKSTLVPLSLLSFIWTFNMFNTIYLLTRGGPYLGFGKPGATDIMVTYIYDVAFEYGDYGLAAAWSVVVFLLLLSFSVFYVKQTRATEAST